MRSIRAAVLLLVLALFSTQGVRIAVAQEAGSRGSREINTIEEAIVTTQGSFVVIPTAALVCSYVPYADAVILGTVQDVSLVQVADGSVTRQESVISMLVTKTWKATHRDSLRVRLPEDAWGDPGVEHGHPAPQPGSDYLLYLVTDERDELVAMPGAVAHPDTSLLWNRDGFRALSTTRLISLVDSCAALWGLPAIAARSDIVLEGTVVYSEANGPSCDLQLEDLVTHKGAAAHDTLHLVVPPGGPRPHLPSFESGQRVVLFVRPWGLSSFELVGGRHGAWIATADGTFQMSQRHSRDGFGVVASGTAVQVSHGLSPTVTRAEFTAMLSGS